ncbi:MAG: hypothetical protein FJ014_05650 [Chloroflexi bacterium]|nr:hypothetical protein [Chloroflexota bacterium]
MKAKRKTDPQVYRIQEHLETLLNTVEDYCKDLEVELTAARAEAEPYAHLIRALEMQITTVRKVESLLDDQVWPEVIHMRHGSSYVAHTRTRDYF